MFSDVYRQLSFSVLHTCNKQDEMYWKNKKRRKRQRKEIHPKSYNGLVFWFASKFLRVFDLHQINSELWTENYVFVLIKLFVVYILVFFFSCQKLSEHVGRCMNKVTTSYFVHTEYPVLTMVLTIILYLIKYLAQILKQCQKQRTT